jgi:hypothetical protein
MAQLLHLGAMNCLAVILAAGQLGGGSVRPAMGYELFSWRGAKGEWEFQLLFNTNSEKTSAEVFNEKTALKGFEKLKRRIRELPEGSTIFWLDRVPSGSKPKAKGSDRLKYPPANLIKRIKRDATERHVGLKVLGP